MVQTGTHFLRICDCEFIFVGGSDGCLNIFIIISIVSLCMLVNKFSMASDSNTPLIDLLFFRISMNSCVVLILYFEGKYDLMI